MTVGEGVGLFGLIRAILLDRPSVKVLVRTVDHAHAGPNVVAMHVGLWTHVEVHNTGRVPVRVTAISIELADGQLVSFEVGTVLPATIIRPELVNRSESIESLRKRWPGGRARRIRVDVSPDKAFHAPLPGWDRFPDDNPPSKPGDAEGILIAWV